MTIRLKIILVLLTSFFAVIPVHASAVEKTEIGAPTVINQVLFSESKGSWTARDLSLFGKIKKEMYQKNRISQWSESDDEDFLLSRLSAHEALLFEITPPKLIKLDEAQRASFADFTLKEIDAELTEIGLAQAIIDLKESQLKQKIRFKTWFDLLKRKYQVKIKSSDFKMSQ